MISLSYIHTFCTTTTINSSERTISMRCAFFVFFRFFFRARILAPIVRNGRHTVVCTHAASHSECIEPVLKYTLTTILWMLPVSCDACSTLQQSKWCANCATLFLALAHSFVLVTKAVVAHSHNIPQTMQHSGIFQIEFHNRSAILRHQTIEMNFVIDSNILALLWNFFMNTKSISLINSAVQMDPKCPYLSEMLFPYSDLSKSTIFASSIEPYFLLLQARSCSKSFSQFSAPVYAIAIFDGAR